MEFTFAELLRSLRVRASHTQVELARGLGVSRNTVGAWERGLYLPASRDQVLRLADELALTPDEADRLLRAAEFPAQHRAPCLAAALHQLRPATSDFVGRGDEISRIVGALRGAAEGQGAVAISGVQGMGGVGKTELAYVAASRASDLFPDGQIVVDLAGSSAQPLSPEQALQQVLWAWQPEQHRPMSGRALTALYRSALHRRRVLILADDARDGAQVRALVPPAGCALLITSRQRFLLDGMLAIQLERLAEEDAVRLLCTICGRLTQHQARRIAALCGGLPLALRVSADILATDPSLKVEHFVALLADEQGRLAQLRHPDDPGRDVAASLNLSYALLEPGAQAVFEQLGVLVSDFGLPMAEELIDAPPGVDVAATLRLLLRRSLVEYDPLRERWSLHALVRSFSLARLRDREAAQRRVCV